MNVIPFFFSNRYQVPVFAKALQYSVYVFSIGTVCVVPVPVAHVPDLTSGKQTFKLVEKSFPFLKIFTIECLGGISKHTKLRHLSFNNLAILAGHLFETAVGLSSCLVQDP